MGRGEATLYQQDRRSLLTKNLPRSIGFSLVVVGAVGATAFMLWDLQNDPSTPRLYYLLLFAVWCAFLEALLIAGPSLSRSRFAVWKDAFAPPFRQTQVFARKLPALILFDAVRRMVPATQTVQGREQLYGASVELVSGERLFVLEGDVGGLGVRTLLDAWSAWNSGPSRGGRSVDSSKVPPWIGREWREEAAIGVLLLVFLVLIAVVLFAAGNPASVAGIAYVSLAVLGSVFAVGWIAAARSRARKIARMYGSRFKVGP